MKIGILSDSHGRAVITGRAVKTLLDAADEQAPVFVMHVSIDGSDPQPFTSLVHSDGVDGKRGDPRFGADERGRVFVTTRQNNTIYLTNLMVEQPVRASTPN